MTGLYMMAIFAFNELIQRCEVFSKKQKICEIDVPM